MPLYLPSGAAAAHPDLATHDALGLATQAELDALNEIAAGLEIDMPAPVAGVQTIGVTSTFSAIARPQYVRAVNPETVNNSNAVQDDDELFLSVVANAVYEVHGYIFYDGAGSGAGGADFRLGWSGPAGATFDWVSDGLLDTVTAGVGNVQRNKLGFGNTSIVGAVAAATNLVATPSGILVTSGTAGTFRFRWAQGIATASDTIRQAGSTLVLHRLA